MTKSTKQTFDCPGFQSVVGAYVGLLSELIYQAVLCALHTKTISLGTLSEGAKTYFVMKPRQVFCKLDLSRLMLREFSLT